MRAAICRAYGPPDVVVVEEIEAPALTGGQVRVRIAAAAVNFPDVLIVADSYQISAPTPFVPGSEFAGVVIEVADDVAGVAVGDAVTGTGLVGAFAEEAIVASAAVQRLPDGIDLRTAAAFGVAHRTAYHVLRSVARVQAGDEVVVLGAGGGVGLAAVQLASLLGASVTAVASSQPKLDVASSYGARHLINHRDVDLRQMLKDTLPEGSDVVIDPVGGGLAEPALRSLRRDGRFVTVGYASGTIPRIPLNLVLLKGIAILGFEFRSWAQHEQTEFARNEGELLSLLAAGRATPHIGATFPLDDVVEAMQLVGEGQAIGKVVLDIGAA
jgi:NADPH:quinone reductase